MVGALFISVSANDSEWSVIGSSGTGTGEILQTESPIYEVLSPRFWQSDADKSSKLRQILDAAIVHGENVDHKNEQGWSGLTFASEFNDLKATKILLDDYKADVNSQENDLWTPLHFAAFHGHREMVELLVGTYDADVSILNHQDIGPVTFLRRKRLFELAERLTNKGMMDAFELQGQEACDSLMRVLHDSSCNPDAHASDDESSQTNWANFHNEMGWSPLHFCANAGDAASIRTLLLYYGADINARENDKWTPLMFAVFHGYVEAVNELLLHAPSSKLMTISSKGSEKADLSQRNNNDMTALDIARLRRGVAPDKEQEKFDTITAMLLKASENVPDRSYPENAHTGEEGNGFLQTAVQAVGTFFFGENSDSQQPL